MKSKAIIALTVVALLAAVLPLTQRLGPLAAAGPVELDGGGPSQVPERLCNPCSDNDDLLASEDSQSDDRRSAPIESKRETKNISVMTPLAPGYCASNGGSTAYEYISSITYANNPGGTTGTMMITVEIFITNPTGCTYGDPCPEYDSSPEYVNVWVDWDGDNTWEDHEKVIDEALTGYHDLNYYGTMTISAIVTIPSGAADPTWMRANLGWDHDPNDPCELSWTWGDVFDEQVSTATDLPQIEDIVASGPPGDVNNPMTTQPVTLQATISTVAGYVINTVSWSGDGIPAAATGNPYTYTPAAGTHGNKNVQCVIAYEKSATGATGEDTKNKGYKLFFVKSGDEDGDSEPNWFEHWAADGPVPDMATALYDAASPYYGYCTGAGQVYLTPSSAGQHYGSAIVLTTHFGTESFGGPAVTGIDCAGEIIAHELYHKWVGDQWDSGGIFHGQTDSDRDWHASEACGTYTCYYRDELPDSYENVTSHTWITRSDTYDLEHLKSGVYRYYGDQEYMAMRTGDGVSGNPAKDWANPGKQTTPAYRIDLSLPTPKATGPVEGGFTGNNTDEGNDTNGDGLYDYLTVSSEVEVTNGGIFKIVALLKDAADEDITFINKALVLETGIQTLTLDFDGIAIRRHGADGEYKIGMLLTDEEGNELDQQDYVTSAYEHEEFQQPLAEFYDKYSDYPSDTDEDDFYNYLVVEVNVRTNTAGQYTIAGWLYDLKEDKIVRASESTYLEVGVQSVGLAFDGAAIRQHRVDGPYRLAYLSLHGVETDPIDFILDPYTTQSYDYQAFQPTGGAELTGDYESWGEDPNGNKLYDFLAIDVGVRVLAFMPATYTVAGWLYDRDGNYIGQTSTSFTPPIVWNLSKQVQFVTLNFGAKPIYKHGADGPYILKYVSLYDENGVIIDHQHDAHATASYNYQMFQPLVLLTGVYTDDGEDVDGNGLYDSLEVCVEVLPSDPGYCVMSARLLDNNEKEIIWAHYTAELVGNESQELCLDFDGRYIYANMVEGPYHIGDVYVYHTGDANVPDYMSEVGTTAHYSPSEFEKSGVVTGKVTRIGGGPIPNALVSIGSVDYDYTDADGNYVLTTLKGGTYTVEVVPPLDAGVLGDSASVSVIVGQTTVQDFALSSLPRLDLVITDVKCDRGNKRIGYEIKNIGNTTVPAGHNTALYVDGAYQIKELVDVDLAPGATSQRHFDYSWECTLPEDDIEVCADIGDSVDESDETNNCKEETCSCNQVYLDPQGSSTKYCDTTEVEVWVDGTEFQGGQMKLQYDSACADVTNWERNTDDFLYGTWESDTPGEEWILFAAEELVSGEYLIGTLTIHCVSEEEECTTALSFVAPSVLKDNLGNDVPATWMDGTFECTVGTCGDVAPSAQCDGVVDVKDFILLLNYVGHPGEYPLCCEECGDVAPSAGCDGAIDVGDFILLLNYAVHPDEYHLCCEAAPATIAAPAPVAAAAQVAAGAQNEVEFVPEESSAPFGGTTEVEVWADAIGFQGGQMKFTYDSTCGDVTNWERNRDDFLYGGWESDTAGEEWILFAAEGLLSGEYLIGTLTIHCVSEEECTTALDFVDPSGLSDDFGNEVSATWTDGIFRKGMYEVYLPLIVKNF